MSALRSIALWGIGFPLLLLFALCLLVFSTRPEVPLKDDHQFS